MFKNRGEKRGSILFLFSILIVFIYLSSLSASVDDNGNVINGTFDCYNTQNCDDQNDSTRDECINPGTVSSKCNHEEIKCFVDADCGKVGYGDINSCFLDNLFREYKMFSCVYPGTTDSFCKKKD
ncbi:hypothetical protein COU57_03840 [Candidatus Pacearchaeota archaeon CG10_big_fil_rev_8_21_14_0_10_32_14]|nr:MAG: hypothetical protein COU57_03840 [Candidatus Pacearchaeota archaeon CG10_big_fil_rev_8_21_14_0_10_32_14]